MRIAALVASIIWFAGLVRLFGEAGVRGLSALSLTASDRGIIGFAVVGTTLLVVLEGVALWRWTWYRDLIRQSQADIRSLYGLPPRSGSPQPAAFRPQALVAAAVVVLPTLVVAAILPGMIAATVAVVVGLIARVVVAAAAATRDIPER
jgi:hypothetical protein